VGTERGSLQHAAAYEVLGNIGGRMNQGGIMGNFLSRLWSDEQGEDIAEYSVMLAVILVIVVGTVRLIGSNAGNVFSQVGSAIQ
jgi:Flp pilus assembly pilin Flp